MKKILKQNLEVWRRLGGRVGNKEKGNPRKNFQSRERLTTWIATERSRYRMLRPANQEGFPPELQETLERSISADS